MNAYIKFGEIYRFALKILSGKEIMTDRRTNKGTDEMTDNPNPSAQYLENKLTEFHQIFCYKSFFTHLYQNYGP